MAIENMARKIKELRQAKGLTLEQVANVVGVGKSTVRKWETGMIANMKRDKIADLAKALGTTPAYLMGWEESPELNLQLFGDDSPKEPKLSEGEQVLLDLFRRVPNEQQQLVLQMIRAALGSQE